MKTKQEIKNLIDQYLNDTYLTIKQRKKKLDFANNILRYLETEPNILFIEKEIKIINKRINSVNNKFHTWTNSAAPKNINPKNYRAIFNKETGITIMKKQLKALTFIIE